MKIHCAGCALLDNLYGSVNFQSSEFLRFKSRRDGDGGLVPGQLVFAEDLALFSGESFKSILKTLTGGREPDTSNVGGPAIIPLIHAAQMLEGTGAEFRYFGMVGEDWNGRLIRKLLKEAPVDLSNYKSGPGHTPATDVLSDPDYNKGHGERTFINQIGLAADPALAEFDDDFFQGDLVFFGGTALVPPQHDNLTELTTRARNAGAFVVVTTVFDFRNEKALGGKPWPLVDDYTKVDLLVVDQEEALKISGVPTAEEALEWFLLQSAGAVIVTRGNKPVLFQVQSDRYQPVAIKELPVCHQIDIDLKTQTRLHDTTGCGDNFVGGVLASLASQISRGAVSLDLTEAVAWGVVSGGYAATYLGGLYGENTSGEKRKEVEVYWQAYRKEVQSLVDLSESL